MRPVRHALMVALAGGAALIGTTLPALADPGLTDVARHRHFVLSPAGKWAEVGPRVCDNPSLQQAFNQFHFNIHHSENPMGVFVETLGPQDGAPGLHNGFGSDLMARGCSFQPPR
jgi:hypothetical protein